MGRPTGEPALGPCGFAASHPRQAEPSRGPLPGPARRCPPCDRAERRSAAATGPTCAELRSHAGVSGVAGAVVKEALRAFEVGQWCCPGPGGLFLAAAPGQMNNCPAEGTVGDTEQDVVAGFAACRRADPGTVQRVVRRQFPAEFLFQGVQDAVIRDPPGGGEPAGIVWRGRCGQHRFSVAHASFRSGRGPTGTEAHDLAERRGCLQGPATVGAPARRSSRNDSWRRRALVRRSAPDESLRHLAGSSARTGGGPKREGSEPGGVGAPSRRPPTEPRRRAVASTQTIIMVPGPSKARPMPAPGRRLQGQAPPDEPRPQGEDVGDRSETPARSGHDHSASSPPPKSTGAPYHPFLR
ncbi:hypothetical protein SRIMM317S_03196 [Streptomyces rimosus subsp. rimosus]